MEGDSLGYEDMHYSRKFRLTPGLELNDPKWSIGIRRGPGKPSIWEVYDAHRHKPCAMTNATPLRFTNAKPPADAGWPGLRPGSSLVDGMLIERDVAVTMRDGIRIYVDVCRPEAGVAVPVLLAYGPFGKHRSMHPTLAAGADIEPTLPPGTPFEAPVARYWVRHGYAVVYADPRGTWGSEGDATLWSAQEAQDGYELVEWAGTQPWSNGRVGMSGVSYLAMSQYRVAATRPPHLAAINPSEGISDLYRSPPRRIAERLRQLTRRVRYAGECRPNE